MPTKNEVIADALKAADYNPRDAYLGLVDEIGIPPLDYTFNPGSGAMRQPRVIGMAVNPYARSTDPTGSRKPHRERTQHEMCLRHCYAVLRTMRERPATPPADFPPEAEPNDSVPVPPVRPTPPEAMPDMPAEVARFLREVERYRGEMKGSRGDFDPLDSMRITIDGVKAIKAGVPVDGLLAAIGAAWNEETRRQMRVPEFDYAKWGKAQPDYDPSCHAAMPYVRRLLEAGIPVWLHGPAGTSKSSIAKACADIRGVDYHEVNLAAAMASAVKGKDRLNSFVESEFTQAYVKPSVLALEEFDSAMPSTATAINNAIANGHFHNDADGKVHTKDEGFRIVATANSLGMGATKQFSSRMNLDGATKDRFRMGRVFVGLDKDLERTIIAGLLASI